MGEFRTLGPCFLLMGDPTEPEGAGMEWLGRHENVSFNPGIATSRSTDAFSGDVAHAGSIRYRQENVLLTSELYDQSIANLKRVITSGEVLEESEGDGEAFGPGQHGQIIETATLFVLPVGFASEGADSNHALWLPAAHLANADDLYQHGRLQEEDNNPFSAEFNAAVAPADMGLPAKHRVWFRGSPAALDLTWSVPDLTELAAAA